MNHNLALHKFIWLLVTFFPLLPNSLGAQNAQKIMHLSIISILIFVFLCRKVKLPSQFFFFTIIVTSLLFVYYSSLTLLNTYFITAADYSDLIRQFVYLGYILFAFALPLENSDFKTLLSFLKKILIFQIVFSVLVYIPPLWPLVDIFKGRPSDDMALHFYRWSGTYGYPSDFSFFISFFIFYYFSFYARRIVMKKSDILLVLLLFFTLFMSFSRGGIFSTFGVLGILFWFTGAKKRKTSYILIACTSLLLISTVLLFSEKFQQVNYILQVFGSDSQSVDGSTGHRLYELDLAAEYAGGQVPFSQGANREELAGRISIIESFYGYHLIKFGFLGLFFALSIKLTLLILCVFVYKRYLNNIHISSFSFALIGLIISEVLFFGFSSAITDRFKTLPTFYLMIGYMISIYFRKQPTNEEA